MIREYLAYYATCPKCRAYRVFVIGGKSKCNVCGTVTDGAASLDEGRAGIPEHEREKLDREGAKGAGNGLGKKGIRDPEHPCDDFDPREPGFNEFPQCETDGHYLCEGCAWRKPVDSEAEA